MLEVERIEKDSYRPSVFFFFFFGVRTFWASQLNASCAVSPLLWVGERSVAMRALILHFFLSRAAVNILCGYENKCHMIIIGCAPLGDG
jgi:hypothetical protein